MTPPESPLEVRLDTARRTFLSDPVVPYACRHFPEPIADLLARAVEAVADPEAGLEKQYLCLLHVGEIVGQFLGVLAGAEYLRLRQRESGPDGKAGTIRPYPQAEIQLDRFSRPGEPFSVGHWWQLRAACERALADKPASELFARALWTLGGSRGSSPDGWRSRFDLLPNLRNRTKGHSLGLEDDAYGAELLRLLPTIVSVLRALQDPDATNGSPAGPAGPHSSNGLGAYRLVRVLSQGDDPGRALPRTRLVEDLIGSAHTRARHLMTFRDHLGSIQEGDVVLVGPGGDPSALSLHPMVRVLPAESAEGVALPREVGFFQSRADKRLTYLGTRHREPRRIASRPEDDRAFVRGPSLGDEVRRWKIAGVSAADLLDAAQRRTDAFIQRMQEEKVYIPGAFVDRERVRQPIEQFLSVAPWRVLFLTGMAGSGKTAYLCQLARDRAANELDLVLLVSATALPAGAGSIERELLEQLGVPGVPSLASLARQWSEQVRDHEPALAEPAADAPTAADAAAVVPRRIGKVLLLVDGVDRAADPAGVLDSLLRLGSPTEEASEGSLKVVASVALPVLEGAAESVGDGAWIARWPGAPAGGIGLLTGDLDEAETRAAWAGYRAAPGTHPLTEYRHLEPAFRAAIRNPLLLRLACEVYNEAHVPKSATELEVLTRHAQDKLLRLPERRHLARLLVGFMCPSDGRPRRSVPVSELLSDAEARDVLLRPDSPFDALMAEQVLVQLERRAPSPWAPPDQVVEFAFDATLGYLLFAFGLTSQPGVIAMLAARFAAIADRFAPGGYALDLALRALDAEERAGVLGALVEGADSAVAVSAAARLLVWLDAARPVSPEELAVWLELSMPPLALPPDLALTLDALVAEHLPRGPEREEPDAGVRALEESPSAQLLTRLAANGPKDPRVSLKHLLDVAEQLAGRGAGILAGLLADRILSRIGTDDTGSIVSIRARILRANALVQTGAMGALLEAASTLDGVVKDALVAGSFDDFRSGSLARAHALQLAGRPREALETLEALFVKSTAEFQKAARIEALIGRADLLRTNWALGSKAHLAVDVEDRRLKAIEEAKELLGEAERLLSSNRTPALAARHARVGALLADEKARAGGLEAAEQLFREAGEHEEVARIKAEHASQVLGDDRVGALAEARQALALVDRRPGGEAWFAATQTTALALAWSDDRLQRDQAVRVALEIVVMARKLGRPLELAAALRPVHLAFSDNGRQDTSSDVSALQVELLDRVVKPAGYEVTEVMANATTNAVDHDLWAGHLERAGRMLALARECRVDSERKWVDLMVAWWTGLNASRVYRELGAEAAADAASEARAAFVRAQKTGDETDGAEFADQLQARRHEMELELGEVTTVRTFLRRYLFDAREIDKAKNRRPGTARRQLEVLLAQALVLDPDPAPGEAAACLERATGLHGTDLGRALHVKAQVESLQARRSRAFQDADKHRMNAQRYRMEAVDAIKAALPSFWTARDDRHVRALCTAHPFIAKILDDVGAPTPATVPPKPPKPPKLPKAPKPSPTP